MPIGVVLSRHDDRVVRETARAVLRGHEVEDRRQRLLGHARARGPDERLVTLDAQTRGLTERRQLGRRLVLAQVPDDGRDVAHLGLWKSLAQLLDELQLAREPAVPHVQRHRLLQRVELLVAVLRPDLLRLEHRVDRLTPVGEPGQVAAELVHNHRALDPGRDHRRADEVSRDRQAVSRLLIHREEQHALLARAVDDEDGVGDLDARQVEEIVALAKRHVVRRGRRAQEDGGGITDLRHQAGAPPGVLRPVDRRRRAGRRG